MTPGNRYPYEIFIDNSLICSEWDAQNIFFFHGGPGKN